MISNELKHSLNAFIERRRQTGIVGMLYEREIVEALNLITCANSGLSTIKKSHQIPKISRLM